MDHSFYRSGRRSNLLCTVSYFSVIIAILSHPEYRTFSAMIQCFKKVDGAMGTRPASGERQALARQLSSCAGRIRGYRSRVRWGLENRIRRQQVIRVSLALKSFTYPAMLGTDQELALIKEAIARAAIRVGTRNWVQVGDLDLASGHLPRRLRPRVTVASVISFLVILVPLITVLVSALTKK